MDLVIAYDVNTENRAGERRLRDVAKLCEGYGIRRQKSLFEARMSDVQLVRLVADLEDLISPTVDSVVIYHLHSEVSQCRRILGVGGASKDGIEIGGTPWVL